MADPILPGINVEMVGEDGRCTQPWYLFFRRVERALQPGSTGSLAVALSAVRETADATAAAVETVAATVETVATTQAAIESTLETLNDRVTDLEP
jgi:hypothetical protein